MKLVNDNNLITAIDVYFNDKLTFFINVLKV